MRENVASAIDERRTVTGSSASLVERLRSVVRPRIIARSFAAAVITIVASPFLVVIALLLLGAVTGENPGATPLTAITWALSVGVTITVVAVLDLLFGIVAVARVQVGERLGRALLSALVALPRLLVVLLAAIIAALLAFLGWPLLVVAALVTALVLLLQRKPGVRRALLAAIPFLPLLAIIALIPASLVAAAGRPTSIRALVVSALATLRTRGLLWFVIAATLLSAAVGWVGSTASTALDSAGLTDLSVLALGGALALLMVVVGAAVAVFTAPQGAAPQPRVRTTRGTRLVARVAVLVTASLILPLLPVMTTSPAHADTLIAPTVFIGRDGGGPSPLLSAFVTVPGGDPAGSVQFFDGATAISSQVRLTTSGYDPTSASAYLSDGPVFDPGEHSFTVVFTPDSPLVESGVVSGPMLWQFVATTEMTISADADAGVGTPAEITVAVAANFATAITPPGTVLIEWDGGSTEVELVGGIATYTIPELTTPDVWVSYAGSTYFTSVSNSIQVGVVLPPDDTEITAEVYNPPHVLGTELLAVAQVTAPLAAWNTVVKGNVVVWQGTTLLTEAPVGHALSIPTVGLHAGPTTLRFEFVPDHGFTASETTVDVTIAAATTTATATVSDASTAWGEPLTLNLDVASSDDGERTVEIRDTRSDTLISTQAVTISDGEGTASIDYSTALRPGYYSLVATVVGDGDHAEASTTPITVSVGAAITTIVVTVLPNPAEVGSTVTVTADLSTAATLPDGVTGEVYFRYPDSTEERILLTDGQAIGHWTPTTPYTGNVTVSYFDDTFQFASSGKLVPLAVTAAVAPAPIVEWSGTLTPADRTVTLTYTAAAGRDVPTGSVRILDADGVILSSTALVDGVATLPIYGTLGAHPVLTARYMGDAIYGVRDDLLDVSTLTNYLPTVSVNAPANAALGLPFPVSVEVLNVPLGLVASATLKSTDRDGVTTTLGTVPLDGSGQGTTNVTLLVDGEATLWAVVGFTEASELAPAESASTSVNVAPVPVPSLLVTTPNLPASLVAGAAVDIDVTASWIGLGTTGVPAGTTAQVLNGSGALLGTVTLFGAAGVDGYRGRLHLTNVAGGTLSVHASVVYGPLDATATSASLDLVIAPPETVLVVQATQVTVGTPTTVDVTAYPLGGLSGPTRSVSATVTADGVDYPVTLNRTGATGAFTALLDIPTLHAGEQTITASTPGNGIDASAAEDDFLTNVSKRVTSISTRMIQATAAGEDIIVYAKVLQTGTGTSPAPTGAVTVISTRSGASCVVGADFMCTIPGDKVYEGLNTFTVSYLGDAENLGSAGDTSFTVGPRTSHIDVTFSPASGWVFGEPVTATWTTTTSGRAAVGAVYVTIAGVSCHASAATGSCTLTPTTSEHVGPVSTSFRVNFLPSDDAPATEVTGTVQVALCVYPNVYGSVDYLSAVRCGVNGTGVLSGSTIRLSATAPDRYVVHHWLSGDAWIIGATPEVTVYSSASYIPSYQYQPACFTLTLSPTRADRATNGGYLSTYTQPNCDSPTTTTAADLDDLTAGHPRYAAGTVVLVSVQPNAGEPTLVLDTFTGAPMLNDQLSDVTMSKDTTVTATFKVADCTAVSIFPTMGGTVAVTSAVRPASSSYLKPATGACTTYNGHAGYVPGTKLTYTATADADTAISTWTTHSGYPPIAATEFATVAVRAKPTATAAKTYDFVVPAQGVEWQVYARFAQVRCVSVTLVSRSIVSPNFRPSEDTAPKGILGEAHETETGCGGVATTRTVRYSGSWRYRIVTETTSYLATGWVNVTAPLAVYTPNYANVGTTYVLWESAVGQGAQRLVVNDATGSGTSGITAFGWTAWAYGPSIDLDVATAPITISGNWVAESACHPVNVDTPQGGSYILQPVYADEPFCEKPNFVVAGQSLTLKAAKAANAPGLTPILSGSGVPQFSPASVFGGNAYVLEYCTPLNLDVRILDDAGRVTNATAAQAAAWMADDGGCPNGWTRPNRTVNTALSPEGAVNYTVPASAQGYGPSRTVDAAGLVSGPNRVDLKVVCFTLDVGDASITTPGNCPGGASNRFLRGSQVQLQAEEADRFDGWNNVDAQQGETAWVIMSANRYVEADIYNYSWYEEIGNALSSVAQRLIAAVVTVATGALLAEAFLVKAAGWALTGTAAILHAAGVNGAAVDGIESAGRIVAAQFDAVSLLASCMTSTATGGGTPILTVPSSTTVAPTGGGIDETIERAKAQLGQQLGAAGINASIPLGSLLGDNGDMIDLFGSGLSGYSANAASSWQSYGSSISECTQRGVQDYAKNTFG
jgi:hypothetical protein